MTKVCNTSVLFAFLFIISTLLNGCTTAAQSYHSDGLPILSEEELIRPYTKLGRIQVNRETFGSDYSLSPDIKAWGLAALRQQGEIMGADAIILLEVTGRTTTYGIIPSAEYRATGFAIKFK
jgi:hypothetical protein